MENPFEMIMKRLDAIETLLHELRVTNSVVDKAQSDTHIMNIKQLAEYLKCSKSSIYKDTSTRKIPHYKRGKRVYFKKTEIDEWITQLRVKTSREIEMEASAYIIKRGRVK
jgi:excisionase family DNA binding protein